jgi:hypothetical protein
MRRYLLIAALALMTVWATGCIIIDAEKMESRKPAAIRSEECVVRQSLGVGAPALDSDSRASAALAEQ